MAEKSVYSAYTVIKFLKSHNKDIVTTTGMLCLIHCHQSVFGITKVVNG